MIQLTTHPYTTVPMGFAYEFHGECHAELCTSYVPMDRRQAMSRGKGLSHRTTGAALFADISGFTRLGESLSRAFGSQRGAEELTYKITSVYQIIIGEVHRFGGSVIAFSGDAITCWFDADQGQR